MHISHELTQIAFVVVSALLGGMILVRLKQPVFLGYVAVGVLLGPSGFCVLETRDGISLLAELGILLLLFLIGLELDIKLFKDTWKKALMITSLQIGGVVLLMAGMFFFYKASWGLILLLGFIGALSSTAVAIKMLESSGELKTKAGRLTMSILIAQDLAFVPMILIVRACGENSLSGWIFLKVLFSVALLGGLIHILSRLGKYKLPFYKHIDVNSEMIALGALAFCFVFSACSGMLGLSAAYGAFIAGLVLGNSEHQKAMIRVTHPIQSLLMMVFFLSIGLLLDLSFIWKNLLLVGILVLGVTLGKVILNAVILRGLKYSWYESSFIAVTLAQLGEFSFLLASVGKEAAILDPFSEKLVVALTALSLGLSPIWHIIHQRLHDKIGIDSRSVRDFTAVLFGKERNIWCSFLNKCRLKQKESKK